MICRGYSCSFAVIRAVIRSYSRSLVFIRTSNKPVKQLSANKYEYLHNALALGTCLFSNHSLCI